MDMMIPAINITFAQMFTAIFSGTFGLIGPVFLLVGIAIRASINKKRSYCTDYTEGTVSDMQTLYGSGGLRVVYSFSIDGKPLQYVSSSIGNNNLLVGQSIGVYYDPQNIGRVYIEEETRQIRVFSRVFIILGSVFFSVALIVAVVLLGVL
jgi:hypothetical protein